VLIAAGLVLATGQTASCFPQSGPDVASPPGSIGTASATATAASVVAAADAVAPAGDESPSYLPDIPSLMRFSTSELREVLERYASDRSGLFRRFNIQNSGSRRERARAYYTEWRAILDDIEFDELGLDGRVDHILFRNRLDYELQLLDREERIVAETAPLIPFADQIIGLQESRRRMETIDPEAAAAMLTELDKQIKKLQKAVEAGVKKDQPDSEKASEGEQEKAAGEQAGEEEEIEPIETTKTVAYRAARRVDGLKRTLENWFRYYNGYDPMFTWWATDPHEKVDKTLEGYAKFLREKIVGFKEGEDPPIVGDPIGRDALLTDLKYEMIPYTPEELVAIANREFEWCEREMLRASREMGFGDDWKAALEHVKELHVEPGKQADLIRDQALEAIAFLEERDLLTIPPLARDIWRIEMMSPERQKMSPFFLGGEVIQVSFPTNEMTHEDKLMSMRGNNIHFARATVQHELIPGHHLQGFMTERYNSHRGVFSTPFWGEGWALYWEMLLWDLDFPQTPENRMGMLFWRSHRCARIIFSLGFHLGTMTPQECVDFLVDRVGHERANAEAEVRRSFEGSYSPLYQAAYMLGGLQFRALHEEIVGSGQMTNREFHDAILKLNRIPVELVRATLLGQDPSEDFSASWRFAGPNPGR
jgi:hypothetical protein